ncbi:MAG: hypothetical protein IJ435_04295 [Clostridia bacterium]|nr:hypothetical protein [Clostridia bacterium]
MSDEKLKEKFPNIKTEEELFEVKKYLFKRACGIILLLIAFVCLVLDEVAAFEAGLPWSTICALLAVFFFYSSWKHKDFVFRMKEDKTREIITKKMMLDEMCDNYSANKRLIGFGVAGWSVFMLFIFCKNGMDYISHNWIGFVIVMGIIWTLFIIWLIASKLDMDKARQSLEEGVVVLSSPVKKKFTSGKGGNLHYFSFESENYGKYNKMVLESEYYVTEVGDAYYLLLRKAKKKYKLMAIFSPKKWELDEELKKYLVEEVNI